VTSNASRSVITNTTRTAEANKAKVNSDQLTKVKVNPDQLTKVKVVAITEVAVVRRAGTRRSREPTRAPWCPRYRRDRRT
jgi:hypothetical protein